MERTEVVILTNMCMLKDSEGRYLVIDRVDPNWGGYVFPGGHVEKGEVIRDSVVREMFEETGITVYDPRLCGIKQFLNREGQRYMVFLYRATRCSGELVSSPEGKAEWLSADQLRAGHCVPGFWDMFQLMNSDTYDEMFYHSDEPDFY